MLTTLGVSLALLVVIGMPLGFAIIIGCMVVIFVGGTLSPLIIPQRIFAGIDSFSLLAIPFFLLAGSLMTAGGLSDRIIAFANCLVGRFRGGLAISNVVASIIFGGISGSAVADTSAIGGTFIPAMKRSGYTAPFSVAITAVSSPLSPLIPPSIAWIIYAFITDQSVLRMFVAGIVPGLVWGAALIGTVVWMGRGGTFPVHQPASLIEVWRAFRSAFTAVMMPAFILVGILSGVFTVTEASAIAVVYAILVGWLIHRELTLAKGLTALRKTARTTAVIMIIVGGAKLFAWVLAYTKTPEAVATWITTVAGDATTFLLLLNGALLVLGTFMEVNAAKVMMLPIIFPIAIGFGIDPIHFGVIITTNLCIGLITPPVGIVLALACKIGDISLESGTRASLPFLLVCIGVVLALTFVPGFSLWLPNLLLGPR